MKIYFAGVSTYPSIVTEVSPSVLESYLYFKSANKYFECADKWGKMDLFVDSGAYSAFTQGIKINIDEYIEFIKITKPSLYANLDVIGDADKTYKNWLYMKDKGLNPLPVIHVNSERKYFDIYLKEHKVEYIALGGLVPIVKRRKYLKSWLDYCYSTMKSITGGYVKTHLFGVTTQWVLERYPAYSADSTLWLYAGKRGRILEFKRGKLKTSSITQFYAKTRHYGENNLESASAILKMENYLTELWDNRHIKFINYEKITR